MFLQLRNGKKLGNELRDRICMAIGSSLSSRLVQAFVLQAADIPYAINGRKIQYPESLAEVVWFCRHWQSGATARRAGGALISDRQCVVRIEIF